MRLTQNYKVIFNRAIQLYVKITGVIGIFFAVCWTLGTIGQKGSETIIDLFVYTAWLIAISFQSYPDPYLIVLFIFTFLSISWIIVSYREVKAARSKLDKPSTREFFIFVRKQFFKRIYEFCLYTMSLFVTIHIGLIFTVLIASIIS